MKNPDKVTISTIIHDLKTEYSRVFKEKFPVNDRKMEEVLNSAAKEAKKRKIVEWFCKEDGTKAIRITERKRRQWIPRK